MAHYRRKKCKRQVRCCTCTPYKCLGNNRKGRMMGGRFKEREYERERVARLEA